MKEFNFNIVETTIYNRSADADDVYERWFAETLTREEFDALSNDELGEELRNTDGFAEWMERYGNVDNSVLTVTADDEKQYSVSLSFVVTATSEADAQRAADGYLSEHRVEFVIDEV